MAGTISNTTIITKVPATSMPIAFQQQADKFVEFSFANHVMEVPYIATFDHQAVEGYTVRFNLVYEKQTKAGVDHFGIDLNVQVQAPNTADADLMELKAFYGITAPNNPVWVAFTQPPVPIRKPGPPE